MDVITTIAEMSMASARAARRGKRIGFVPTMGFFHEGHMRLMRRARRENDFVVVSLFVNPLQFGPREDFKCYPRDRGRDIACAQHAGVDVLFLPSTRVMYRTPYCTNVIVRELSEGLCGASRPGHFVGVATVVAKLFNIVRPTVVYFGQKDYQQVRIIQQMVRDLNIPLRVRMCPIVRERDGVALSSRNVYLTPDERVRAQSLSRALRHARVMIADGERRASVVARAMRRMLVRHVTRIDYVAVCDGVSLRAVNRVRGKVFIGIAAYIGATRLIDNSIVRVS